MTTANGTLDHAPLDHALDALLAGKATLPVKPDGSKAPAVDSWKSYQSRLPTEEEVRFAIGGNLCRCTGYSKVVQAILKAAETMQAQAS